MYRSGLRNLIRIHLKQPFRSISCTQAVNTKEWRVSRGLPVNKNAEGILTDGPDYTFLDGRPTPLLVNTKCYYPLKYLKLLDFYNGFARVRYKAYFNGQKQKLRMLKNREFASKIVELSSELDFAKSRHQKMLDDKEQERQTILRNRLKPKGKALLNKK